MVFVGLEERCIKFPNTSPSTDTRLMQRVLVWGFPPLFYIIIIIIVIFKPKEITSTRKVYGFNQSHSRTRALKKRVPAVGMAHGKK